MQARLRVVTGTDHKTKFKKVAPNLLINTESGYYFVRKTFRRLRIPDLFESTRELKIGKAKAKADQMIKDHLDHYLGNSHGGLQSKRHGKLVNEIVDEILLTVTPTKRKGTQENHRLYLGELKKEWGYWEAGRISLVSWAQWLEGFKKRKERKTFFDYAKHMSLILRYAYSQKYVSHLVEIPNPDATKETGRVYTTEEIQALWDHMTEETRDQFVLCFECFMRLREALYLTWDRVNLQTGVITLRAADVKTGSKTGKGRAFRMSDRALERIKTRKAKMEKSRKLKGSPFVFPSRDNPMRATHSNKKAWVSAKANAKIRGRARWHDLRHTALNVALLDSKVDPILVSEYAGVSLRTIQKVYLHSTHEKTAKVAGSVKVF